MLGLQPAPGLEQRGADPAADPGGECGGGIPPVHPALPFGRAAARPVRTAAGPSSWRVAKAQVSHGPLDRMQGVQPCAIEELFAADLVEQPGAQLLQVRAAVEQEHLTGDHRQQRVVCAAEPVAPPGQHLAEAADLTVHPVAAEDPPGQSEAAEAAELAEGSEAAEKEGVRRQVGAHRVIGPGGGSHAEAVLVAAEQAGPLLIGPAPVRPAGLRAPQQHHRVASSIARRRCGVGGDSSAAPASSNGRSSRRISGHPPAARSWRARRRRLSTPRPAMAAASAARTAGVVS
jgi:hypothetical protein